MKLFDTNVRPWWAIYIRDALHGYINSAIDWYLKRQRMEYEQTAVREYYMPRPLKETHPVIPQSFLWAAVNMLLAPLIRRAPARTGVLVGTVVNVTALVTSVIVLVGRTRTFYQIARVNDVASRKLFPTRDL